MNTQTQITHTDICGSIKKARLVTVIAITLAIHTHQGLASDENLGNYDENMLFNPSEAVLLAEAKGRVTIFDALEHRVVDRALDTQFHRIENMMFVRTRETSPDGGESIEDDGC